MTIRSPTSSSGQIPTSTALGFGTIKAGAGEPFYGRLLTSRASQAALRQSGERVRKGADNYGFVNLPIPFPKGLLAAQIITNPTKTGLNPKNGTKTQSKIHPTKPRLLPNRNDSYPRSLPCSPPHPVSNTWMACLCQRV